MPNKMLIDASHREETRVVVTRGNKVEEFDFESADRRQLRGNIYLAKVTRVEPSLQAAFIEYGGNRHGFLAFSEIHPDYYQIPIADRQALIEAERDADHDEDRDDERRREGGGRRRRGVQRRHRDRQETVSAPVEGDDEARAEVAGPRADHEGAHPVGPAIAGEPEAGEGGAEAEAAAAGAGSDAEPNPAVHAPAPDTLSEPPALAGAVAEEAPSAARAEAAGDAGESRVEARSSAETDREHAPHGEVEEPSRPKVDEALAHRDEEHGSDREPGSDSEPGSDGEHGSDEEESEDDEEHDEEDEEEVVEQVGGGADALEDVPERPRAYRRNYKIQEVIKRRQILLIQVVKEERGNKGAALTTYLSLAGRYAVLMPNTGKGGGISRKITSAEDRKRLKEIVQELEVPEGMGIILRTAGAARSKPEIKRDYEYLLRLWESVRELTLNSSAPALVYEEGSLVKRAIRDLYNKDIDEVVVAGDEGYREAKDFMRMIMPSQAKAVKPYAEAQALFASYGVEAQLDAMFSNHVTLRSGGYLVINPTEALVSIDVNSGRSTREHNIEDTALRTNLEAAEEIARQLRLRDLAGLIVIDFIDMEERRNDRAVEKKLKDCLRNDRARIQLGRISSFGLLEMSRQRIRTGVLESSSVPCRHCGGTGFVRSAASVSLQILRSVEESLLRSATHNLAVRTRGEVAFYTLNQKRRHLAELEARFGVAVAIGADESLAGTTTFAIDRGALATPVEAAPARGIRVDTIMPVDEPIEVDPTAELELERESEDEQEQEHAEAAAPAAAGEGEDGDGRRRRRRRRRRGRGNGAREGGEHEASGEEDSADDGDEDEGAGAGVPPLGEATEDAEVLAEGVPDLAPGGVELPLPSLGLMIEAGERAQADAPPPAVDEPSAEIKAGNGPAAPETGRTETAPEAADRGEPAPVEPEPEPVAIVLTPADPDRPKRGGWWSRAKSVLGT